MHMYMYVKSEIQYVILMRNSSCNAHKKASGTSGDVRSVDGQSRQSQPRRDGQHRLVIEFSLMHRFSFMYVVFRNDVISYGV